MAKRNAHQRDKKRPVSGQPQNRKGPKPVEKTDKKHSVLIGVVAKARFGWGLIPANRRDRNTYFIKNVKFAETLQDQLVTAAATGSVKQGRLEVVIEHSFGKSGIAQSIPLIAIHGNALPTDFPDEALAEAEAAAPVPLGTRDDLRKIPLVTIDGEDARDFDDAVFAEKDGDGWHVLVAIADVAHYVRQGSALDREAYHRGNSTYLPDRVIPMLPEALSNELCSLKPDVDRACLAVHMWFDGEGELTKWKFVRGLMRSHARLTYTQVQAALDGNTDATTKPMLEPIILPLFGAFRCLIQARIRRGTLELDLPERKVLLNEDGSVKAIVQRRQADSHRMIEEFMIAANVAAAAQLEQKGGTCLYRIHDKPSEIKQEVLRTFLDTLDISLVPAKQMHPRALTHILEKTAGGPHAHVVNEMMLRTQAQAVYSPENIGHFGLALAKYAHFTSPIRRYADLVVHRGLIAMCKLGEGGLVDTGAKRLKEIGEHISGTERRSIAAERDAVDRYTSLYLSDKAQQNFTGRISGVSRYGLFVRLNDLGADGIIPFKTLPRDYYTLNEAKQALVGERHGRSYQIGQTVDVRLEETDPLTGALSFSLIEKEKTVQEKRHAPKKRRN